MTFTIVYSVIFLVFTLVQMSAGIGPDRTYFSYYVPYLLIITRLLFLGRTLGIPVPKAAAPVSELAALSLSLFFFAMAVYKHNFEIDFSGLAAVIGTTVIIIAMELIHDASYVYTLVDENDCDM